jgi:hypothetical protein
MAHHAVRRAPSLSVTDNTRESATAHYGDIVFKQACD